VNQGGREEEKNIPGGSGIKINGGAPFHLCGQSWGEGEIGFCKTRGLAFIV